MSSSTKQVGGVEVFTPEVPKTGALGIGPTSKSQKKRLAVQTKPHLDNYPDDEKPYLDNSPHSQNIGLMKLKLDDLILDPDIQSRLQMSVSVIQDYTDRMREGDSFPPIEVFYDAAGGYYVADGFHRTYAARQAGKKVIEANVCSGTKRDAIRFSVEANNTHGLPKTNKDRENSVKLFLKHCLTTETNREIGRICGGVHHATVQRIIDELKQHSDGPEQGIEITPEEAEAIDNRQRKVIRGDQVFSMERKVKPKPNPDDEALKTLMTPRSESPNMVFRLLSAKLFTSLTVTIYYLLKESDGVLSAGQIAQIIKTRKDLVERHLDLLVHWELAVPASLGWKVSDKVSQELIGASHVNSKELASGVTSPLIRDVYLKSLSILNASGNGNPLNKNIEDVTASKIRISDVRKSDTYLIAKRALSDLYTEEELNPKSFGGSNTGKWVGILMDTVKDPEDLEMFGWWFKKVGPYGKNGFSWSLFLACWDTYAAQREKVRSAREKEAISKDSHAYWDRPTVKKWVDDTLKELEDAVAAIEGEEP